MANECQLFDDCENVELDEDCPLDSTDVCRSLFSQLVGKYDYEKRQLQNVDEEVQNIIDIMQDVYDYD